MRTLAGVLACFGFFWGAWAVSVAEIKSSLHVSDGQFGLVLTAALLAAAATNAVAGSLGEYAPAGMRRIEGDRLHGAAPSGSAPCDDEDRQFAVLRDSVPV